MEIKIYAPVNCEVKSMQKCSDPTFAEKMLGDGIVIEPKNNVFASPFENAICTMIFETKHAYGFEVQGCEFLIHCGIDTVNLNGKPFKTNLQQNMPVKLGDQIFSVDLKSVRENNLSTETPIIFTSADKKLKIKNFEEGTYKKGELICVFEVTSDKKEKAKIDNENEDVIKFESKYTKTAKEFIELVGGRQNFSEVYNCMTRLRFKIKNKDLVDSAQIEKNSIVKGINWNGSELQVIIGGECYKVKDEILKLDNIQVETASEGTEEVAYSTLSQKIFAAIAGIMAPNIPILMSAGIIAAIYSILNTIGVTVDLGSGDKTIEADMLSLILYVLSKTGILLIGVFFCYNTTKYFGGDPLYGMLIGLILASRFFMGTGAESNAITKPSEYEFGKFIMDAQFGSRGWYLFSISNYPIVIKSYEGSVLPYLAAGIMAVYIDIWVKKWMPSAIDIVFRAAIVVVLTVVPVLFVIGPALSLVEFGMTYVVKGLGYIPLGIGVGLFAMVWQPLVLTGVHVGVYMTLLIPLMTQQEPSIFLPAATIAVFGQVGACLGVAMLTKNPMERRVALGAIPGGIFGITEPIIYSTNLPKLKPFLVGCIAAFVGGTISGIIGIAQLNPGAAQGFLYILGVDGLTNQLLLALIFVITAAVALGLMLLTYSQKLNELKYSQKLNKKIDSILKNTKLSEKNKKEINEKLLAITEMFKENKEAYSKYEKYIQSISKFEASLISLEEKEEKHKTKLFNKVNKLKKAKKQNADLIKKAVAEFNSYSLEQEKQKITDERENYVKENAELVLIYEKAKKQNELTIQKYIDYIQKQETVSELANYSKLYSNALNSVEIGYGLQDKVVYKMPKEFKTKLKNKEV
ncbi:PTS system, beta-glucoside-specific IIABC component [Mesoplasma entomophilum]|uniref:PTS beta-glucoside transporter subunit IIABC n=1 Tax=Mesoplasma entomophilum TaxID=2149 RepID=A0A3S5XY47_9MOLU|nr:glucose PTS transporter subunit IIA [Mesoplasma entomophilum]ATQ35194.1 hypothetical protein CS528_00155 [Mesoplasma entomophilum]ATZ19140.1 PTS system, beta-glucoside-specific IIABC component [Mesoplasma entomophilum]